MWEHTEEERCMVIRKNWLENKGWKFDVGGWKIENGKRKLGEKEL